MIELDDLGELAWVPLALLAAGLARWSRPTPLPWRDGTAGPPGGWDGSRAAMAFGRVRGDGAPCNRRFEQHRTGALRRLDGEQREFSAFAARPLQARGQADFGAFMAERAK